MDGSANSLRILRVLGILPYRGNRTHDARGQRYLFPFASRVMACLPRCPQCPQCPLSSRNPLGIAPHSMSSGFPVYPSFAAHPRGAAVASRAGGALHIFTRQSRTSLRSPASCFPAPPILATCILKLETHIFSLSSLAFFIPSVKLPVLRRIISAGSDLSQGSFTTVIFQQIHSETDQVEL